MSIIDSSLSASAIVAQAETWLGVPYLYGGGRGSAATARSAGVDCSGFVYQVFMSLGIDPGTDTVSQFNNPNAVAVPSLAQAQPGDLIFFGSPVGGTQEHVGIYLGSGLMIDAPHTGASVRIDSVTGFGETMLGIRRITTPAAAGTGTDPASPNETAQLASTTTSSSGSTFMRLAVEVVAVGLAVGLVGMGLYTMTKKEPNHGT